MNYPQLIASLQEELAQAKAFGTQYFNRMNELHKELAEAREEIEDMKDVYYDVVKLCDASGTEDVRMDLKQILENRDAQELEVKKLRSRLSKQIKSTFEWKDQAKFYLDDKNKLNLLVKSYRLKLMKAEPWLKKCSDMFPKNVEAYDAWEEIRKALE